MQDGACVDIYCLHRPGDSAAAGQSAAAAVDIIVLTFETLRLGMWSCETDRHPGWAQPRLPSVTGDPRHQTHPPPVPRADQDLTPAP